VAEARVFDGEPLLRDLEAAGLRLGDAAMLRIFKREKRLELWMAPEDGPFRLFRSYPIAAFSGGEGPKLAEGDRQAPEGFYRVGRGQLNPRSRHHRAFNLGFPNACDRQLGRTGSLLMVHGGSSSAGCYAMTDAKIDEIYRVVEAALHAGRAAVDVHAFPFRFSEAALAAAAGSPWSGFWRNLAEGDALFLASGQPPPVAARDGTYRFGADAAAPGSEPILPWD